MKLRLDLIAEALALDQDAGTTEIILTLWAVVEELHLVQVGYAALVAKGAATVLNGLATLIVHGVIGSAESLQLLGVAAMLFFGSLLVQVYICHPLFQGLTAVMLLSI